MRCLNDKYKRAVRTIRTETEISLPRCDVSKNYRHRMVRVLEEAFAGLTWVA